MSAQLALFSPDAGPQGLRYQPSFISADDERGLIAHIRGLPLAPFQFGAFEGKRRVASFGWRYDYNIQKLQPAEAIPPWIVPVISEVERYGELRNGAVQQVLCTEYEVGAGIGWHRDKPHFDKVFGLSLASACKLRFRRRSSTAWERFTLDAQPRSLYLMSDKSRRIWEHSIPPVETPRYSITFRSMTAIR